MLKKLLKRMIIGFVFTITVLIFHSQIVYASSSSKTVTTQKQLMTALKSNNIDKIIIKPTQKTAFNIEKKNYDKDLTIYQNNVTVINNGKFNRCEIVVTNAEQSTKALEYIQKYHRTDKTILHIMNAKKEIVLSKNDFHSWASLLIEKSNCNITNKANWKSIEISGMGTGEFKEYGNRNDINVTGDIKKITVAEKVDTNQIYYNQEELQNTTSNRVEMNGTIHRIKIQSNLDLYITGKNVDNIQSVISNVTDDNIVVYVENKKYIFDINNNLVTNENEDSDSGEADSKNDMYSDDNEADTQDLEDEDDADTPNLDNEDDLGTKDLNDDDETETEDLDDEADSNIDTEDEYTNDDSSNEDKIDSSYNYKEYTINLGDGNTTTVYGYFDETASYNVYLKVNELRASLGLSALKWDTKMLACAETRASELIQSYSHTRPNGTSCFTVLDANGISYSGAGENIAAGYLDADAVMKGWTNSPGHYANMTKASFTKMTAGCIIAKDDSDKQSYKYYWVQMFGN